MALFQQGEDEELTLQLEYVRTGRLLERTIRRDEAPGIEARLVARIQAAVEATVFPPDPGPLCGMVRIQRCVRGGHSATRCGCTAGGLTRSNRLPVYCSVRSADSSARRIIMSAGSQYAMTVVILSSSSSSNTVMPSNSTVLPVSPVPTALHFAAAPLLE